MEIDAVNWLVADAAGGGDAWPVDDRGNADTSFVRRSLAAAQRQVFGELVVLAVALGQAAVVRGEDHHGIVGDPLRLELIEHTRPTARSMLFTMAA